MKLKTVLLLLILILGFSKMNAQIIDLDFQSELDINQDTKDSLQKMVQSLVDEAIDKLNNYPVYNGDDLGLTYAKKKSTFKVWSPPATAVSLHLFDAGEGGKRLATHQMKKEPNGVWSIKVKGKNEGLFYTYQVHLGDSLLTETVDPYAIATGVNGKRAMIVDLEKTNPDGWDEDVKPPFNSISDAVIYELHIRDMTVHEGSGIEKKGKFLGLAETGTLTPDGLSSGIDHLKELGVTHVHLLPVFDFASLDEAAHMLDFYNWGYDPLNYNVPEGTYSTDPYDGRVRIREFKELIKKFHENGIRVIMDVVYNHTGPTEESSFNKTVPYYYYRWNGPYWADASGCGNETATERPMMRKFMIESMKYWAKEYHIDGFRVDLMGIHDTETMNQVTTELKKIDPSIIVYGEGWAAGTSPLDESERALKNNMMKLSNVSAFSDEFRDGVKGPVFMKNGTGFISGNDEVKESVKFGIVGAIQHDQINYDLVNYAKIPWANDPTQCINYVSCHDNHTLWDRLKLSCRGMSDEDLLKMNKLAQTLVFTSQGIPFLHAGEEFVRSKSGVENSYKSPDHINQIDWRNKKKYNDLFQYYRQLIRLKKEHPVFKIGSANLIRQHLRFVDHRNENIIGYEINGEAVGDSWKKVLVVHNGNKVGKRIDIPAGEWKIVCHNYQINLDGMGTISSKSANLLPLASIILVQE